MLGISRERQARDVPIKRSAQKTPEPMGEDAASADGRRFVVQEHHAPRLHWDLRLEHDGVARLLGGPERPARGAQGQPPGGPHRGPSARVPRLRRRDPGGPVRRRARCAIWDRGTYEVLKWEPRKVEVAPPRRARARPLRAVPDRQGRGAQELDDPPHGPARRPGGASRCPSRSSRCWRAPARCRATTRTGPSRSSGTACARICHSEPGPDAPALAQPARHHRRAIPELGAARPRAQPRTARCSTARSSRSTRGPPELRRAAAAHARRLEATRPAPGQGRRRSPT